MSLFAKHVPEGDRAAGEGKLAESEHVDARLEFGIHCARLRKAGEIAFYVGHKNRHADRAELLGHYLQRHCLAGAGGAGDQSVAIGKPGQKKKIPGRSGDRKRLGHVIFRDRRGSGGMIKF